VGKIKGVKGSLGQVNTKIAKDAMRKN
jgi:hypothetical protein